MNCRTIYDYFKDYSEKEIDEVIELLPIKAKQILKQKYGNDLKNTKRINKLSKDDTSYFGYYILYTIRKKLHEKRYGKKNKNIYDYFKEYSTDEVDEAIKLLTPRAKKVLELKYGDNLRNPLKINKLNEKDASYFSSTVLFNIRKKLKLIRNGEDIKKIYDYFKEYSMEEVDEVIKTLSYRARSVLILKYGDNFKNPIKNNLSEKDKVYFQDYILKTIRSRLKLKKMGIVFKIKNDTIYDYFKEYSMEEVDRVLENLSSRGKEVLFAKYGDNLKNPQDNFKLSNRDSSYFKSFLLLKIERQLKLNRQGIKSNKIKTIYDYFNDYSKEEVDEAIKLLTSKAKKVLEVKYGSDLKNPITEDQLTEKETKYFYGDLLPTIRKKLKKVREINENNSKNDLKTNLIKEDYKKLINILKQFILNKLLTIFTYEESIVIILKLILNYDIKIISNLLNVSEEEILNITKKFLTYYKYTIIKDITLENKIK
ncbi:MAG: hypothetical protein IJ501_01560 [Bacilli bacterium]|nr:hypothetical protein [Bacilli bacterium]